MSLIILTSTTDILEVVTSAAATIDVVASWVDAPTTTLVPNNSGTTVTAITTATTTTVVAAPGASTSRSLKSMTIRNKHATASCDITVQFDRSATNYELHKVTLLAGQALEYEEGLGFFTLASSSMDRRLMVTGSDYVNATTSFTDITGLTVPVLSGRSYNFLANLYHVNDATTTGSQFGANGTLTTLRIANIQVVTTSVTAAAVSAGSATAVDTAATADTTGSVTGTRLAIVSGYFVPSADSTFALRGKSEVAVAAGLTVKVGSWMRVWEPTG